MNSTDGGRACFQSNPDISGVGVRVSFYVQTSVLGEIHTLIFCRATRLTDERSTAVLIANWPHSSYDPAVLWALVSSNLGLTIASMTQAAHAKLSFLQGLQVSNLVWYVLQADSRTVNIQMRV